MIHALSIVGDVFWILALALMASLSWGAGKRIASTTPVPVVWRGGVAGVRVHKLAALWLVPVLVFAAGIWLKFESRAPGLDLAGAFVALGVRASLAPLAAILHMGQVRRALQTLDADGQLKP
ncbi:MAG: hypothetical protein Q8L66_01355 [Caulobacter sp.]|nr:hypothetical protein [Caulobacter sp.]